MTEPLSAALEITAFWRSAGREAWFAKDHRFDDEFRRRCQPLHFAAARRDLDHWTQDAEGALALMLLLDQFPRNCFRGSGHMYATDPLARSMARRALGDGHDQKVEAGIRVFFYLPFSHSENLADQQLAVERAVPLGEEFLGHAIGHRDIVLRFGRFPHRNRILGRRSTAEEQAFLDAGGFAG